MKINIRLLSSLKKYCPYNGNSLQMELEGATTAGQLLGKLNIPLSIKRVILVNGYHGNEETVLAENDQVTLFPPMGGG